MYRLDEFSQAEIPEKLTFILERLNNHLVNQYQYAAILLHYLFIEVGFTLQTPLSEKDAIGAITPSKNSLSGSLAHGAGYQFKYSVNNNLDTISMLQIIPNGVKLSIVGIFGGQPQVSYSMEEISATNYIQNINSPSLPARFQNLKSLSREFKNRIALPLISHIKNVLDLPVGSESFSVLHNDAILAVLEHIKSELDIVRLGQCSKRLNEVTQDNSIWKGLVQYHFPNEYNRVMNESNEEVPQDSWKDRYKKFFEIHKSKNSRTSPTHHIPFIPDPFFPRPFQPPGRDPFNPRFDPPDPFLPRLPFQPPRNHPDDPTDPFLPRLPFLPSRRDPDNPRFDPTSQ